MRTFGKSPRTGLVLIAISAFLVQGCAVAVVGGVAAVGGLGYGLSREQPETAASAAPDAGSDKTVAPAAAGEPDTLGQPAAESEPEDMGQPAMLVEPQAPVESVEVQPIQ
jgi:hypothetical protein